MIFKDSYAIALGPRGEINLPISVRRNMVPFGGTAAPLMTFGVQFLNICAVDEAEELLMRIYGRLCDVFGPQDTQVADYLLAVERSMAKLQPLGNGRYILPPHTRKLLNSPSDGMLTLMGVDDHLELWNRAELETQTQLLKRKGDSAPRSLLETQICLHMDKCTLLKDGKAVPKRCGRCIYLRLP